ncbi:ATP-dependent DNA helicase [uncultured Microbacterium sp.]|uniref:UvrD/REP family DEAD/DEAH box helicase n=1 Tax=uncultured Microbacterium sp. TaxID=191216 RepID=UPI0025D29E39|nr:ATP-dependent DNA helicase [uncultured Microbacterium sp.]
MTTPDEFREPRGHGARGSVPPSWPTPSLLSGDDIAAALGKPAPTAEQRAVIEAPPSPALVVAGAGSGKTETMAGRVVWLVANGHVRADEVLGLTFTRKAAGELAERVEQRLRTIGEFARRGLLPSIPALRADGTLAAMWQGVAQSTGDPRRELADRLDAIASRSPRPASAADGRVALAVGAVASVGLPGAAAAGNPTDATEALLARPRISTYNAFADTLVREHAARIGRDSDDAVMSDSAAWLLARRVVIDTADERLAVREDRFGTVVDAVHRFAGTLLDHRADPAAVASHGIELATRVAPFVNPELQNPGDIEKLHRSATALPVLVALADEYARAKRARGVLDFADQVAGALDIIEAAPAVASDLRDQYRVVLLDEYQDTSVLQTRLLSAIFAGTPVMAVGDPHQSIYGWRGASADNLDAFPRAFGTATTPAERYALIVSWRNDVRVLGVANAIIEIPDASGSAPSPPEPIAAPAPPEPAAAPSPREPAAAPSPREPVAALAPRPGASEGEVDVVFVSTIDDEAERVAAWFASRRAERDEPRSGAILFRAKRHMTVFGEALARAGVPHRILGLGGLLSTPEVVDVVSALRVIDDASAGSALLRLLTGPRFAIGLGDLDALRDLSRVLAGSLARFALVPEVGGAAGFGDGDGGPTAHGGPSAEADPDTQEATRALAERVRSSVGPDESASIVDALDVVAALPPRHGLLDGFSDEGTTRLREAGEMFRRLRALVGAPIAELVHAIEVELRLDVELAANESRGPARLASVQLRAFVDEVRGFLATDERGSLRSLLAWLDHAEETDDLMPRTEPPEPGVVQLLTIHGSKGLEWDDVAVVRLVTDELPKRPRSNLGELGYGELPVRFRGDRDAVPIFRWEPPEAGALDANSGRFDPKTAAAERKRAATALRAAITEYKAQNRAHAHEEERRLAYVAVTRARHGLLLSGSRWGGQREAREPSEYLDQAVAALGLAPLAVPAPAAHGPLDADDAGGVEASATAHDVAEHDAEEQNPYEERVGATLQWPLDPLGARRQLVEAAAEAVRDAAESPLPEPDPDVALLLAEREARGRTIAPEAPGRLAASHFKEYVSGFDRAVGRVARPLPERPYRQTRIGTLFHAWVERRAILASGAGVRGGATSGYVYEALWEIDDDLDGGEGFPGSFGVDSADAGSEEGRFTLADRASADSAPREVGRVDAGAADRAALERLQQTFEASEWGSLAPLAVELEIDCTVAGAEGLGRVVCKLDAVYRRADRGGRIEIVDWKTGSAPHTVSERDERMFQLALYRLAYHKATGVPLDEIDVALFYVSDDLVIRGSDVPSESALAQRWNAAREARSASRTSSAARSSSDAQSALGSVTSGTDGSTGVSV